MRVRKKKKSTKEWICSRKYTEISVYQGSHRSGKSGNSGKFLKTFSSQGNQGKTGGGVFSQNQGKKFQIRELFFQTIFKPFKPINLRKMFFKTVKPQELSGNCNICID